MRTLLTAPLHSPPGGTSEHVPLPEGQLKHISWPDWSFDFPFPFPLEKGRFSLDLYSTICASLTLPGLLEACASSSAVCLCWPVFFDHFRFAQPVHVRLEALCGPLESCPGPPPSMPPLEHHALQPLSIQLLNDAPFPTQYSMSAASWMKMHDHGQRGSQSRRTCLPWPDSMVNRL